MSTITKRIIANTGMNQRNPALPPIHGRMGFIYLKPEMKEAEAQLARTRILLHDVMELEKDPSASVDEKKSARDMLFENMAKLEKEEAALFAKTWYGKEHKQVLTGWVERQDFRNAVDGVQNLAYNLLERAGNKSLPRLKSEAIEAAEKAVESAKILVEMTSALLDGKVSVTGAAVAGEYNYDDSLQRIRDLENHVFSRSVPGFHFERAADILRACALLAKSTATSIVNDRFKVDEFVKNLLH